MMLLRNWCIRRRTRVRLASFDRIFTHYYTNQWSIYKWKYWLSWLLTCYLIDRPDNIIIVENISHRLLSSQDSILLTDLIQLFQGLYNLFLQSFHIFSYQNHTQIDTHTHVQLAFLIDPQRFIIPASIHQFLYDLCFDFLIDVFEDQIRHDEILIIIETKLEI